MKSLWIKTALIVAAVVVGYGAYVFSGKPDTPIEQGAEAVLQHYGIDVDLSP